jgi:hypothetical protein
VPELDVALAIEQNRPIRTKQEELDPRIPVISPAAAINEGWILRGRDRRAKDRIAFLSLQLLTPVIETALTKPEAIIN